MDWWKMFGSTFILIFLAELGDKTQLAAMARAADGPGGSSAKWAVFLAASSALVLSTLIAVFFGGVLKSLVPDERYIKIAAGLLFVVFGIWILAGVVRSYGPPETENEAAKAEPAQIVDNPDPGYLGSLVVKAALDFEAAAGEHYRQLAQRVSDPGLARLLQGLAAEEDSHLARLSGLDEDKQKAAFSSRRVVASRAVDDNPSTLGDLSHSLSLARDLVRHERATADFYHSLARETLNPALRPLFLKLAAEERAHAERIEKALESRTAQT